MKKALVAVIVAFLILGLGLAYYFYFRAPSLDIGLEFSKPSDVRVGQPFVLGVSFYNYSDDIVENAKLSLLLPDEVSFVGQSIDQRVREEAVGDIGPGSLTQRSFNLIVLGGAQSLKRIEAKLVYATPKSPRAQFEARSAADVAVGEPAIELSLVAPERVFSGEDFDITVRYESNAQEEIKNIHLRLDYPPVFQFKKSSLESLRGTNTWDIGVLRPGESGEMIVSGSLIGQEGISFPFSGNLTIDLSGQTYPLHSQTVTISLAVSPLSLGVLANGTSEYVAHVGDLVRYIFTYENNSDIAFEAVSIKAALAGELYDFGTLTTNGSFNSVSNILLWNVATTPELNVVLPGESGSVEFTVRLKNEFPIARVSDKNFTLAVRASIESPVVPPGTVAEKTVSLANLDSKVVGQTKVRALGLFRDAASGILNSGPYPPKVNQTTQYTIHWVIVNFGTDVSDVRVSAFLQSGSRFTGKLKSNIESVPSHNPASGEISWTIPRIAATKGVTSPPVEATFQIENTPAINQVGKIIPFLGKTTLQANDLFTGTVLSDLAPEVTTELLGDPTITDRDRGVQP